MFLLPHYNVTSRSLLSLGVNGRVSNVAKKLHRETHTPKQEMKALLRDTAIENKRFFDRYDALNVSSDICTSYGRPQNNVKVSIQHASKAFGKCVQAEFTVIYIVIQKYEVPNVVDIGTSYGERQISSSRSSDSMKIFFEPPWLCHYEAPKEFAADLEFCEETMK